MKTNTFLIKLTAFVFCVTAIQTAAFSQWKLTGNAGTNSTTNYIGTKDNVDFVIRTHAIQRMYFKASGNTGIGISTPLQKLDVAGNINIGSGSGLYLGNVSILSTPGTNNMYFGYHAGESSSGNNNMFLGNYSGQTGGGFHNTFIGYQAGMNNSGANNTFCGYQSGPVNTTGTYNTFFGLATGYSNTVGDGNSFFGQNVFYSNTSGSWNCSFGFGTGGQNTTGSYNCFYGTSSGSGNTTGTDNTFIGASSGYSNSTGSNNIFLGTNSGYNTTTGGNNIFLGGSAGYNHTTSFYNCAIGESSAYGLTTGERNCYYGQSAGHDNATGFNNMNIGAFSNYLTTGSDGNSCFGANAGDFHNNGSNNTFVGFEATASTDGLSNSTAIGYLAQSTASDQVRIGNSSVTSIGGYTDWTNISDGRYKKNIQENVPGLEFINQLRPVTYNLKVTDIDAHLSANHSLNHDGKNNTPSQEDIAAAKEKEKIVYTGFIAQEVEAVAKKMNYDFSGVDAPKNDKDLYGLRYAEFVVPLVKAVQELASQNDQLKNQLADLQNQINQIKANSSSVSNASSQSLNVAELEQNTPNPFSRQTSIKYYVPASVKQAQLLITNMSGEKLKLQNVSAGSGQLTIDAGEFMPGTYTYTLYADGKVIDTKKMVLTK